MSLWGGKVTSSQPLEIKAKDDQNTGIYNAALVSSSGNNPVHLHLSLDGKEKFVVGTFRPGVVEQFPLTIEIYASDEATYSFSVTPDNSEVHLVGSLLEPAEEIYGPPFGDSDSELLESDEAEIVGDDDGPAVIEVDEAEEKAKSKLPAKALPPAQAKGGKGKGKGKNAKAEEQHKPEAKQEEKAEDNKETKPDVKPEAKQDNKNQKKKGKKGKQEGKQEGKQDVKPPAPAASPEAKEQKPAGTEPQGKGKKRPNEQPTTAKQPPAKKQKVEGTVPCSQCDRKFVNEMARDQHTKSAHNKQ